MKYMLDPKRLADAGGGSAGGAGAVELGAAIRALRGERASASEVASLERRMAPQSSSAPSAGAGGVALGVSAKWIATLLLAAAVGWYAFVQRGGAGGDARQRDARAAVPALQHAPAPLPQRVSSAPAVSPPAAVAVAPAAAVVPRTPAIKHPRPHATPLAPSALPLPPTSASSEAELALLEQAQSALDRDPSAALALAEQHAHAYPRGLFTQEREILAIEALLKLRQRPAAVTRASEFVQRYPASPHARRVRSLLERSSFAPEPTTAPASDHSSTDTQR